MIDIIVQNKGRMQQMHFELTLLNSVEITENHFLYTKYLSRTDWT